MQRYSDPELYLIQGDDPLDPAGRPRDFADRVVAADAYFSKPVCRKCHGPPGPRNAQPIGVLHRTRGDGAFTNIAGVGPLMVWLYSGAFLDLLTGAERRRLEFVPVQVPDATRVPAHRALYELKGPAGLQTVALKRAAPRGYKCEACGRTTFSYGTEAIPIAHFIARSDLPRRIPTMFTVEAWNGTHLCMTAARWRELVGKPGTRGLTSSLLGVAPDEEVERNPTLPPLRR